MKWLKNMFSSKKGQIFDQLSGLGVGIAGLAITLVVVFLIMSETKANSTVAADGKTLKLTLRVPFTQQMLLQTSNRQRLIYRDG